MTEGLDEFPVLVKLHNTGIAEARRMTFGDEDVAIPRKGDSRRPVEDIGTLAALARLAQSHQDLPVRRQFEDLITLAFLRVAVDRPDIAFRVWFHRVWKEEHTGAEILQRLSIGRQFPYRRFVRTQTALVLAAVHHPDIVLAVYEDIVGRGPSSGHLRPAGDLFVRIGDFVDAGITGLRLRHANEGRGREYYNRKSDRFHIPPYIGKLPRHLNRRCSRKPAISDGLSRR